MPGSTNSLSGWLRAMYALLSLAGEEDVKLQFSI